MAMLRPAWMQATGGDPEIEYTAAQDRRVLQAIFSREGVNGGRFGPQLRVTQRGAGANMSVDISAGECAIYGDDISDQGAYQCTSTAVENRSIPAAPGSGSRTHRVVARVRDKMHNGIWTGYDWELEVLQDTGSGTPAVPPSAIPLGRVTVAAGQSSVTNGNITDDRQSWSVGTPARQGSFSPIAGYAASQGARLPSWHINPDGWVTLSGWIIWTAADRPITFSEVHNCFPAGSLPVDVRPLGAVRDIAITAAWGPVHGIVETDGRIRWRSFVNKTLLTGDWFSLDGCAYKR